MFPILMQAQEPACVSHVVAYMLMKYWYKKTGKIIKFSPRFLDTLVKRFDGQDRATGGTWPRMVFKLAMQYGCATESTLPNDTTLGVLAYRDDSKLTPAVFADAAQYKIKGFINVPLDFQSVRAATYLYDGLAMLMQIGSEFWLPSWDKVDPLQPPKVVVSGHELLQKGYADEVYNILQNEWSALWGNKGSARYSFKQWQSWIEEMWAIADIPEDVAQFLQSLPAQKDFHYQWSANMARGQFSDDIKFMQVALMILGLLAPVTADELGWYGAKTSAAVGKFQKLRGISPQYPDSAGQLTRTELNKLFAA